MNKKEERNWTMALLIIGIGSGIATKVLNHFYEMNGFVSFLAGLGIAVTFYLIYDLCRKMIKGNQDEDAD